MSHTKICAIWIFILGISVIFTGIILALIIPYFLPNLQDIFYHSFNPTDTLKSLPNVDVNHINWIYGVLGAVMIGWGLVIAMLGYRLIKEDLNWVWNIIIASVTIWFIIDTGISIHYCVLENAILNTVVLVLTAIPVWLHKKLYRKLDEK